MKKKQIATTLGIMCFILTISICIQLKTVKNTTNTASQSLTENGLRDEVLRWKEKYDVTYAELTSSEKQLEEARQKATQNNVTSSAKQEEIAQNNMLLGMTNVKGKGIEITVKDNTSLITEANGGSFNPTDVIVHDGDLMEIVNALKNAGAEAISINGQRIVSTTPITCEGNVIKVNGQKIGSPFVIKAIGSQELLYGQLIIPGGYLELMKNDGVHVEIKKVENVTIDKYSGIIDFKYAKTKK